MIEREKIIALLSEYIGKTDIFIVDVSIIPGNSIVIIADKPEGISIEECGAINRYVVEKLDKDMEDYELMVSSPGIGSPLKIIQQYLKNKGNTVEVIKQNGVKITGVLNEVSVSNIIVEIIKKVKKEGKKKPEIINEQLDIKMNEIKSTRVLVSFK